MDQEILTFSHPIYSIYIHQYFSGLLLLCRYSIKVHTKMILSPDQKKNEKEKNNLKLSKIYQNFRLPKIVLDFKKNSP